MTQEENNVFNLIKSDLFTFLTTSGRCASSSLHTLIRAVWEGESLEAGADVLRTSNGEMSCRPPSPHPAPGPGYQSQTSAGPPPPGAPRVRAASQISQTPTRRPSMATQVRACAQSKPPLLPHPPSAGEGSLNVQIMLTDVISSPA